MGNQLNCYLYLSLIMLSFHCVIGKFSRQKITRSPDRCALRLSAFIPITALPHPFPFPPPLPPPPPQFGLNFLGASRSLYHETLYKNKNLLIFDRIIPMITSRGKYCWQLSPWTLWVYLLHTSSLAQQRTGTKLRKHGWCFLSSTGHLF